MTGRLRASLLATALAVGIGLASAAPASAIGMEGSCSATGAAHCYTVQFGTTFSPSATRVQTDMNYVCLLKPTGFVGWSSVETMWTIPVPANGIADPGFVENGIWNQQGNPGADIVTFYWVRHGGTYGTGYQIFDTNVRAPAGTSHWMQTQYNPAAPSWTIYTNSVLRGTLSSPQGPAQQAQTGGEATTNSGSHKFDTWNHQRVQNATTYQSWPGAGASTAWTSPPWANPPMIANDNELYTRKIATGAAC